MKFQEDPFQKDYQRQNWKQRRDSDGGTRVEVVRIDNWEEG